MITKGKRYSPKVRERAVRMVFEYEGGHGSQWAAILSIAAKIGCTAETLRKWVRESERDQGRRPGLTSEDRDRIKHSSERTVSFAGPTRFFARRRLFSLRRSSTAGRSDGVVHRR